MSTIWRKPDEETEGLYPNLVVCDGRVSGSITIGASRLPIWCFSSTAIQLGWDEVEAGWEPTERYGFTEDDFSAFVYHLLEQRGEFARLLLILADMDRRDAEDEDAVLAPHGPIVDISPWNPDAVHLPAPWWETDRRLVVIAQLQRCINVLSGGLHTEGEPT